MTKLPDSLEQFDWSVTTWEGSRREQMRRWAAMPLADVIRAIEDMEDLSARFRVVRESPLDSV